MKNDDKTDYDRQINVEIRPSWLLAVCATYHGRCPRLPTSASRCVLPSRQILVQNLGHSTLGANV